AKLAGRMADLARLRMGDRGVTVARPSGVAAPLDGSRTREREARRGEPRVEEASPVLQLLDRGSPVGVADGTGTPAEIARDRGRALVHLTLEGGGAARGRGRGGETGRVLHRHDLEGRLSIGQ